MARQWFPLAIVVALCLAVAAVAAEPRGKGGEKKGGGKSPGGSWSERSHSGKQSSEHAGNHEQSEAGNRHEQEGAGKQGAAAAKRNDPSASGKQGAAAGAAAANRNAPAATGKQGAAAGAAAANRNQPQATGAQGAAAGAAAANRNAPPVSGAAGAAAGAAAANRNQPAVSGAAGAAAGAAVANRNQPQVSGAAGAAAGYAAVRNSFDNPHMFGQAWYGDHPGAWAAAGWGTGAAWAPVSWGAVAAHCGYDQNAPFSYDYGVNVTCQDGNVIIGGQSVGTAAEFSQTAADLAATGSEAQASPDDKWLPLGVFAMVRNEHQHPQMIVQLAINEQGVLRGNFTDEITDHTQPIHGAVDKDTQRAAWTVGDNKTTVMEAGVNNLSESEAPALIHKNGKTDHWLLVRLEQPQGADNDAAR